MFLSIALYWRVTGPVRSDDKKLLRHDVADRWEMLWRILRESPLLLILKGKEWYLHQDPILYILSYRLGNKCSRRNAKDVLTRIDDLSRVSCTIPRHWKKEPQKDGESHNADRCLSIEKQRWQRFDSRNLTGCKGKGILLSEIDCRTQPFASIVKIVRSVTYDGTMLKLCRHVYTSSPERHILQVNENIVIRSTGKSSGHFRTSTSFYWTLDTVVSTFPCL